jgi:predicted transglutaminase-like cysteine proteinase
MRVFTAQNLRCLAAAIGVAVALGAHPAQGQILRRDALLHAVPDRGVEPFGLSLERAPAGLMWIRWREFEAGIAESADALARCKTYPSTCSPAETRLIALIDMARSAQGRAKFGLVNREINLSVAYTSDTFQHGTMDVWSSPVATVTSGQGDCEDFAITKYLILREAGVPAHDLRLLVGSVRSDGLAHAVLAARLDGRWLILDNRRMAMLEDGYASDLQPLFAFDNVGVKQFGAPVTAVAAARPDVRQASFQPAAASTAAPSGDTLPLLL